MLQVIGYKNCLSCISVEGSDYRCNSGKYCRMWTHQQVDSADKKAIDPVTEIHDMKAVVDSAVNIFKSNKVDAITIEVINKVAATWGMSFKGDFAEGFRVVSIAVQAGLKVKELRRVWSISGDNPIGPSWEITFSYV